MKKNILLISVAFWAVIGCSQKEEVIEIVKKEENHKKSVASSVKRAAPIRKQTLSQEYIDAVEREMQKNQESIEERVISPIYKRVEKSTLSVVPDHIKNSTIESVPRY